MRSQEDMASKGVGIQTIAVGLCGFVEDGISLHNEFGLSKKKEGNLV